MNQSANLPPEDGQPKQGDEAWARQVIHGDYFPHIDGLRSLAVLPVVFYHLVMNLCPGGFIGVDVFFVISGYLICGGILRDLRAGTFSMTSFYHRRIRRIFPAYFVLVLSVLVAGVCLYHWARLVPLAQTTLFSAFFSANLYFWLSMGYFQPNAHGNPLLNLWSLGVEEQFYIIIPIVLVALWNLRKRSLVPVMALCLLGSFALCVALGRSGASTTAFYTLPTRGWELLSGALLTCLPRPVESLRAKLLALLGGVLLVVSFWCVSTAATFGQGGTSVEIILPFHGSLGITPFPGWVNLPAITGSLLLLRYGSFSPMGRLLCSRPLVGIGKISYSLYLWHWPIIVFAGYLVYQQHPGYGAALGILVLSLAAGYLSWRWVEVPVRLNKSFTPSRAFTTAGAGCGFLVVLTAVVIGTDGFREHLHTKANIYASPPRPFMRNFEKFLVRRDFAPPAYPGIDEAYVRRLGRDDQLPQFCLLGDSHAESLAPGLDVVAAAHGRSGYYISQSMHPFVVEGDRTTSQRLLEWVAQHQDIRDIYLVGRWLYEYRITEGLPQLGDKGRIKPVSLAPEIMREIESNFRRTARWFVERGKRVFVFTCVPEYEYNPANMMARSQIIPLKRPIEITLQDYLNRQAPVMRILEDLEREGHIKLIPLHEAFFSDGTSLFKSASGRPYYRDGDHLTPEGAAHAVRAVATMLWEGASAPLHRGAGTP